MPLIFQICLKSQSVSSSDLLPMLDRLHLLIYFNLKLPQLNINYFSQVQICYLHQVRFVVGNLNHYLYSIPFYSLHHLVFGGSIWALMIKKQFLTGTSHMTLVSTFEVFYVDLFSHLDVIDFSCTSMFSDSYCKL